MKTSSSQRVISIHELHYFIEACCCVYLGMLYHPLPIPYLQGIRTNPHQV